MMDAYKVHAGLPRVLPRWLIGVISAGIVLHLMALVVLVTAAPSGPWNSPFGPSPALPPEFAALINAKLQPAYLQRLHLTHHYHFSTDQVENPSVSFEVILKDENNKLIDTVAFPEKNANSWVRQRQQLLAQNLGQDSPVMRPQGEKIAAPKQQLKRVTIWDMGDGDQTMKLKTLPMHLIPENRPVSRPSEWSQVLAKSYMRYLCRKHGAASATLIRHSRDAIMPMVLPLLRAGENVPPGLMGEEMKANFGEYRVEN